MTTAEAVLYRSVLWGLPFAGLLLSIALLPLAAPRLWHRHAGKVALGWSLAFVLPLLLHAGPLATGHAVAEALVGEYLPFIILLGALYTVAGGIHVRGSLHGSPALNVALMATGALLASAMGTTGASMLLIRPLIRANDDRPRAAHVVVFFIFIVANAAGSLTPLGDPPLFLGFLQGVGFFWTAAHLLPQTLVLVGALLAIFWAVDAWHFRRDGVATRDPTPDSPLGLDGGVNVLLLGGIVALVLMSGVWKPGIAWHGFGLELALQDLLRDVGLVGIAAASVVLTPRSVHAANEFAWGPIREVAELFVGIFVTMIPMLAMLKAGAAGPFAAVADAVTSASGAPRPWAYFWLTGGLSSFLDNAPTYLVFFNLAGGDARELMTTFAPTLAAISAGSVFMGANTYIGNAPNFMVKAIAESRGIRMPGFFGYMLWSGAVLLPLFALVTWIWMR